MSLSDKRRYGELSSACLEREYYYPEADIKQFIQKLKEGYAKGDSFLKRIDKLAGEGLI